jgi:hypothetical protein
MARRLTLDDVEERAAIIEDGEKCTRERTEALTARLYGCKTWSELMKEVKDAY